MVFERADDRDIQTLTGLRIAYLKEDYGSISEHKLKMISEGLPGYFSCHLNKDLFAYVCRDNGAAVSCCFLYVSENPANPSFINGRTGTVMNVYTLPGYRRKGIAGALIKLMLREAEDMALDFVELQATEDGSHLYKSLGFEDVVSKYHSMKYIVDDRNRL